MKHRIFISLSIPHSIKVDIQEIQFKLKKFDWPVRWEHADKLHITMRFLGDITDEEIQKVTQIVQQAAADTPPFQLTIHGFVLYPNLIAPRVMCLDIMDSKPLMDLYKKFDRIFTEESIGEPSRHIFTGHITIGRTETVRTNYRPLIKMKYSQQFNAIQIEVFESVLHKEGSEYCTLGTYNLNDKS